MAVTDYFIPEELGADDGLERRRAELAVKSVYFLLPWSLFSAFFAVWLIGDVQSVLVNIGSPFFVALAPFVLRWSGNLRLTSFFILIPLFSTLLVWALTTGGIVAPGISWLMLLPLLALLFQGLRAATVWMGIVLASWVFAFGLGVAGLSVMPDFTSDEFRIRRMVELVALGTTVFGLFYLKDSLQGWLIETLKQKEAQTRAVLNTAPDGIVTTDLDGTILGANDGAARIFETSVDEMKGASVRRYVASLEQELATTYCDTQGSQEHRAEHRGEEFPVEVAFGLMDNPEGEDDRLVLVFRDITDRKEVEQQLRRARDEALEASRAKSTFLANMSHELRTPLNAVIGYSEMLLEEIDWLESSDEPSPEAALEFRPDLRRIEQAGNHLLALINDILDLSKIEAGKMEIHVESFDVRDLSRDIADTVRPLAADNANEFVVEVADDLVPMVSDITKVRQILFNLLSNACKFTEEGTVELSVDYDEETDEIVFAVEDTGVGMTDEEIGKIFEAFAQADSSTTREFGGTGLGLTITSHFCSLLGGSIDVTSAPGEGTTFTVRLDADIGGEDDRSVDRSASMSRDSTTATGDGAGAKPGDDARSGGETILVVDDDPTIRDLLERILSSEGFDVVTAASGSEGLLLAENIEPSAITLDVMMPSMDGWTMLTKLKENPDLVDIPVIIVSMLSDHNHGYALGADDYLVKPVDKGRLLETLDNQTTGDDPSGPVLIVEDDDSTRELMRRVLENDGRTVIEAEDGKKGLEVAAAEQPAVVLLDLMMPSMDGFEFLQHFRDTDDATPVVVVTAKELTDAEREQLAVDVEDIVAKGGRQRDELVDEIGEMVRKLVGVETTVSSDRES